MYGHIISGDWFNACTVSQYFILQSAGCNHYPGFIFICCQKILTRFDITF